MSEELVGMVYQIADRSRYKFSRQTDPDDWRQMCVMEYMNKFRGIENRPATSHFLYVTHMFELLGKTIYHHERIRKAVALPGVEGGFSLSRELRVKDAPPVKGDVSRKKKAYELNSIVWTRDELCKKLKISRNTFNRRLKQFDGNIKKLMNNPGCRKRKKLYKWDSEYYTLEQLAKKAGIVPSSMLGRLNRANGDVAEAMKPVQLHKGRLGKGKPVTYQGKEYQIPELAKLLGLNLNTLKTRLRTGKSLEEPVRTYKRTTEEYANLC